jgi:hypothetical protein
MTPHPATMSLSTSRQRPRRSRSHAPCAHPMRPHACMHVLRSWHGFASAGCRAAPPPAERTPEEIAKDLERLELIRKKRRVMISCFLQSRFPSASGLEPVPRPQD